MSDRAGLRIKNNLSLLVWGALGLIALYDIIFVLPVLWQRLFYAGLLEWQESMNAAIMWSPAFVDFYRLPPSAGAAGMIYPPLFYLAGAIYAKIVSWTGFQGLALLRIFSFAVPCAIQVFVLEKMGRRHLDVKYLGCVWLVLFLAVLYSLPWLDLIRMDMWVVALATLLMYVLLQPDPGRREQAALGILLCALFCLKQSCLVFFLPVLAAGFLVDRRYFVAAAMGGVACFTAVLLFYGLWGEGYRVWNFDVLAGIPNMWTLPDAAVRADIYAGFLLKSAGAVLAPVVLYVMASDARRATALKISLVAVAMFAVCALSAVKGGGMTASLMGFIAFSLLATSAVVVCYQRSVIVLALLFFLPIWIDGDSRAAIARDLRYDRVIEAVASINNDIAVPALPSYTVHAKTPSRLSEIMLTGSFYGRPLDPAAYLSRDFDIVIKRSACGGGILDFTDGVLKKRHYRHLFTIKESLTAQPAFTNLCLPQEIWVRTPAVARQLQEGLRQRHKDLLPLLTPVR